MDILDPEMHLSSEIGSCRADSAKEQDELSTDQQKTKDRALSTSKGELSTRPSASAMQVDVFYYVMQRYHTNPLQE